MRSWSLVALVVACMWVRDAAAKQPPSSPPELIATIAIGPKLDSLRAYADAVRPGLSLAMSDSMIRTELAGEVHATSLDALDPTAGLYVLVVTSGDSFGMVLAGKVRDPAQLGKDTTATHVETHDGWALIGDPAVTKLVGAYAFAVLPTHAVPGAFVAEIEVPRLVAKLQPAIAGAHERTKQMFASESSGISQSMAAVVDGMFGLLDDVDRAVVTLDATKDIVSVDFAFAAKPHSRVAKFVAAQHPSQFGLLDKLPDMAAAMVVAGRFDAGPYRAGMIEMLGSLYSAGASDKAVTAAFDSITKAATGEVAMVATPAPQSSVQVFAVDDPKHVDQAIDLLVNALVLPRSFEFRGATTTIQTKTKPERHGDARLAEFTFDYDTSQAAKPMRDAMAKVVAKHNLEQVGTVGKLALVAMNADLDRATDAMRGTGKTLAIDATFLAQLAAARSRKDSVAATLDMASMRKSTTPLPIYMIFGYADGRVHVRLALPAATAIGFAKL